MHYDEFVTKILNAERAQALDSSIKQYNLTYLMKYQIRWTHLTIEFAQFIKKAIHPWNKGVWFWLNFVSKNQTSEDTERRAGNFMIELHAVCITKRKLAKFWCQYFWLVEVKTYRNVAKNRTLEVLKLKSANS